MAQSFRCSKQSALYVYREAGSDDTAIVASDVRDFFGGGSDPFSGGTWARLPHTASVDLSPNVQESTQVRTSDTGGLKVKACSDSVSYGCDVTSYLDDNDWLWNYVLSDPTNPGDPTNPVRWYLLTEDISGDSDGATPNFTGAIAFAGRVTPGGFTMDNDSEDPQSTDWSVSVTAGPVFPGAAGAFAQGTAAITTM